MSQKIKQGNLFGRIGTGFGQGLAEQLPKEVSRYRLASGLADIEKDSPNLNRLQLMTRLAGVPGGLENPQFIKEYADVARQQNIRNAYQRGGQRGQTQEMVNTNVQPSQNRLEDIKFGQLNPNQIQRKGVSGDISKEPLIRSDYQNREEQAKDTTNVANENPSASKFVPALAWSQPRFDDKVQEIINSGKADNVPDAIALAEKEQERYMNQPESERRILDYKQSIDQKTDDAFDKEISLLTQKKGEDIFSDIPGEFQSELRKKAREDVATDSSLTPRTAGEKWARIGLDFVRTRNLVDELAERDYRHKIIPVKKQETIKKLNTAAEIYAKVGRSDELFNKLKTKTDKEKGLIGYDLSSQGSALIAYPRSDGLKELIKNYEKDKPKFGVLKIPKLLRVGNQDFQGVVVSQGIAKDFLENKKETDSSLAFAREMKDRYPLFDQGAFFDYIRKNTKDLNPRQNSELIMGESDDYPDWGDISLFPIFGKSEAND